MALAVGARSVLAEDAPAAGWTYSATAGGGFSFTSYQDWQAGGTDSNALTANLAGEAKYVNGKFSLANTLKLAYGLTKVKDQDARKSDDRFDFSMLASYQISGPLSGYVRGSLQTAMTASYLYYDPRVDAVFLDGRDTEYNVKKVKIADGFQPLNLDEGIGLQFAAFIVAGVPEEGKDETPPDKHHLLFFAGAGARQLVCDDYYKESDDAATPAKEFALIDDYTDFGPEVSMDLRVTVSDTALLTSLAKGFYGADNEFWKATWETTLSLGITKAIGFSLTALMDYDELVFEDPQWKTAGLLTLTYQLF